MKRCAWIVITLLLLTLGIAPLSAQAQAAIYLLRDNALYTLDTTGTQQLVADPSSLGLPLDALIAAAAVTSDGDQLYVLLQEGRLSAKLPFPTRTRIMAVDVRSKTLRTLYERSGIFTFRLSPDEQHMTVGYYEADYYTSAEHSCVLDLSDGGCSIVLPYQIVTIPGDWIDNAHVLLPATSDNFMHSFDVTNGDDRSLPLPKGWNLNSGTPIPGTRSVLMEADPRDLSQSPLYHFFVINIDTLEVKMLPYSEASSVILWSFSPDDRYLLFYWSEPQKLIDFASGRLIRQFASVDQQGWLDNDTLVIRGRVDANSPETIFAVDAASGDVHPLATGELAGGILLIA